MSTVTLSKPHCAITSAEKPDGIASQAFTTALPEAQTFLTLFAIGRVFPVFVSWNAPALADGPLNAHFADAHFARGVHYRRPGVVRQGDAVLGAFGARFPLRIARNQHGITARDRLGRADEVDIARNFVVEEAAGIDHFGIDVDRQHAVGETPVGRGGAGAGQCAAEQFADEGKPRALVLAECTDGAGALGVVAR